MKIIVHVLVLRAETGCVFWVSFFSAKWVMGVMSLRLICLLVCLLSQHCFPCTNCALIEFASDFSLNLDAV